MLTRLLPTWFTLCGANGSSRACIWQDLSHASNWNPSGKFFKWNYPIVNGNVLILF